MRFKQYLTEADITKTWISKLNHKWKTKLHKEWGYKEGDLKISSKGVKSIRIANAKNVDSDIIVKWLWKSPALANKIKKIMDFGHHINVELK